MLYYITNFSRTSVFLLYILIKITPMIIAGASINAITATMCPPESVFLHFVNRSYKSNRTNSHMLPQSHRISILNFRLRIKNNKQE
jgi:hypothetical protein